MTNNTTAADLDRDIAHLIDSSENGIARVPRETLVRLRALLTSPRAAGLPNLIEKIAEQWDGCFFDAPGGCDIDIGEAIRAAAKRLDAAPAAPVAEISAGTEPNPSKESGQSEAVISARGFDAQTVAAPVRLASIRDFGPVPLGEGQDATSTIQQALDCPTRDWPVPEIAAQAVAADGTPSDDLLQLDVLLANLHAAVWHAGAGDDGPVDYDMAGKDEAKAIQRHVRAMLAERAAVSPATADTTWKAPKQHCQNGGDVCLAGNRDGVCCPEDSCDIDDGTRKNPAALPIKIPHVHIRPEDEEIGRQYYALGFVDGSRSITDAPATAESRAPFSMDVSKEWCMNMARQEPDDGQIGVGAPEPATADERAAFVEKLRERGADISPLGFGNDRLCITSNIMVDDVLAAARESQAAAPARIEALRKGLFEARDALQTIYENRVTNNATIRHWIEDANRVLNGEQAAAPAEAREPVGRFDKSLNQIRWRDGLVNADFADRQPFYTYPVGATAEAREPHFIAKLDFGEGLVVVQECTLDNAPSIAIYGSLRQGMPGESAKAEPSPTDPEIARRSVFLTFLDSAHRDRVADALVGVPADAGETVAEVVIGWSASDPKRVKMLRDVPLGAKLYTEPVVGAIPHDVRKRVMMHLEDISGLAADVAGITKRDAHTILNVARTAHAMLAQGAQGGKGGDRD
ncbi:hypothetical protein [Burkholderia gladioli]|uniref:hypothetical protein n=1 Tax=Burkholderia gladioli TaxID=28095 RepID=UPI00163F548C|nr:hypothetical protein [Burkholderia gladioli]